MNGLIWLENEDPYPRFMPPSIWGSFVDIDGWWDRLILRGVIHIFITNFVSGLSLKNHERAYTRKPQVQVRTMGPSLKRSLDQNKQVSEGPMRVYMFSKCFSKWIYVYDVMYNSLDEG